MSQALGVKFVDVGQNKASDEQITEPINKGTLKNYHTVEITAIAIFLFLFIFFSLKIFNFKPFYGQINIDYSFTPPIFTPFAKYF